MSNRYGGYPGGANDFGGRSRSRDYDRGDFRGRGGRGDGGSQRGGDNDFSTVARIANALPGTINIHISNHFRFTTKIPGGNVYVYQIDYNGYDKHKTEREELMKNISENLK